MSKKKGLVSIILFFLIIAIALAVMPIIMRNISYHAINEFERSFFIADSGIRYYIKNQLDTDTDWSNNNTVVPPKSFGGGSFTVTPSHPSLTDPDPNKRFDPKFFIYLQSAGQFAVGNTTFRRTVRYLVAMKGAAAFDGNNVLYGGGYGSGDAYFDHINNGTITGDIYLHGTYTDNKSKKLEVDGQILPNQTQAEIPTVVWGYWQTQAAAAGAGHVIAVTSASPTHTFSDSSYSGIYYVYCTDANCLGNAVLSNNNMTVNGTIVVTGDISIGTGNNITFNPAGTATNKSPALVAGNDVNIGQGNNTIFNGTIYAYHNIFLDQANNLTLNGGVLAFGNSLTADHTNNVILSTGVRTDGSGFTGGQQSQGGIGAYPVSDFVETQ